MNDTPPSIPRPPHPNMPLPSSMGHRHSGALRKLVLILAGLSVLVLGGTVYTYFAQRQELSADHIRQITAAAGEKCNNFFMPVWSTASIIREWGTSGILGESDIETFNAKLRPLLEQVPHIKALHILSPRGDILYGLMRRDDQWAAYRAPSVVDPDRPLTWRLYDRNGTATPNHFESPAPNRAVQQRWAVASDSVETYPLNWTPPYALFPSEEKGLSAISGWSNGDQTLTFGLDVRMADVTKLLNDIKVTESTIFFLFAQGRLLVDFQEAVDSPHDMIIKTLDEWAQSDRGDGPFRFQYDGAPWWGLLVDADESPGRLGGLGIFAPEKELVTLKPPGKLIYIPVVLVIFWAFLLAYARRVAHQDASPDGLMTPESLAESELQAIVAAGEHERLEFKSSLRWNLKAGRAGKEIELAVMKSLAAFLNTDGGTLIVGVDDQGAVTGLGIDQFPNTDKYLQHFSNLFNQHIGMEFSPFIRFALRPLAGQQVLVVACRPSPRAVFVKDKQEERFFIRSGASTRQLKTSQVLEYVQERQKKPVQ